MRSGLIYLAVPIAFFIGPSALHGQPRVQLTLAEAQRLAIQNNPSFTAAKYNAAAAYQVAPQYRAAYEPNLSGAFTGVGADNGSRLAAGGLTNPIVYSRIGSGLAVGQMITDFGRTSNLIGMAKLQAAAQDQCDGNDARADPAKYQPRLFRRPPHTGSSQSRRADRRCAPDGDRPGYGFGGEQVEIEPGRQLCERQPGGCQTAPGSGAERSEGRRSRPGNCHGPPKRIGVRSGRGAHAPADARPGGRIDPRRDAESSGTEGPPFPAQRRGALH